MKFWDRLGKYFSFVFFVRAIPFFIVLIIIFVIWNLSTINADKSKDGINQSEFNKYILDLVNDSFNKEIFEFDYNPESNTAYDKVCLFYTFKGNYKEYDAEELAYNEIVKVYNLVKDTKLKKDNILVPKGKDIYFAFYGTKDGKKQEIGFYTMSNLFGDEWNAEDIIPKKNKTILGNY